MPTIRSRTGIHWFRQLVAILVVLRPPADSLSGPGASNQYGGYDITVGIAQRQLDIASCDRQSEVHAEESLNRRKITPIFKEIFFHKTHIQANDDP